MTIPILSRSDEIIEKGTGVYEDVQQRESFIMCMTGLQRLLFIPIPETAVMRFQWESV